MRDNNATILIPDISGFTAFMTKSELSHASLALNILIDSIVQAVGDEYEVSEIEGDCVLLIKKGPPPSKKEILDVCIKIFNAFHFQRSWMQQYTVCPCGACREIINLSLKFVVHHGPLAEIKVGRFVKHSGTEMIVAHRLLKNGIDSNEYLLMTERLLDKIEDSPEEVQLEWSSATEEYPSIGKINYRFALLNEARKHVPEPPAPAYEYSVNDTDFFEIPISAFYRDAYMTIMDIPGRSGWVDSLQRVEQDIPHVFVGSIHRCTFDDFEAVISPLRMMVSDKEIHYAENCTIKEKGISVVHEFVFKNTGETDCIFAFRLLNNNESHPSEDVYQTLLGKVKQMAQRLKERCEKLQESGEFV
jgi:hypothetical protein